MPPERSHAEASRLRARQSRIAKEPEPPVHLLRRLQTRGKSDGLLHPTARDQLAALADARLSAGRRPRLGRAVPVRSLGAPAVRPRRRRRADGGTWLQYWLYYSYQDQDRGIVRTGRHEGDWELVQYRVDAPTARSRRSTRSTAAPSAAASASVTLRGGARSSTPPTARTRPTCARARATGCGPTPTTRPTAAARRPPRLVEITATSPPGCAPDALGRLAGALGSARAGLAARPGVPADRWDPSVRRGARLPGGVRPVGECDGPRRR